MNRLLPASLLVFAALPILRAQTYVRVHDQVVRPGTTAGPGLPGTDLALTTCATLARAFHGQALTGGGTLAPLAFSNPACVNRDGTMAFIATVNGSTRNQGVFVADAAGVRSIARGCGQGGGSGQHGACGDPSPIGGTFAGFFGGTVFTPPINDLGDVLFFCDVLGGSSPRGLFLFQAATQSIVKVAAVGDPSPLGGVFAAIGPGSLNNRGEVVFLASRPNTFDSELFHWQGGVVTRFAAVGDPAPGGGTFQLLGTESFGFQDGTNVPAGPVPSINDCGQVAFRAIVQGGSTSRGIVLRDNGVDGWYLRAGDPVPGGGTYLDFQGAALNGSGEIAVFADFRDPANTLTSGWFAGRPGSWRRILAFFDPVDGGQCLGLAFSRNPMTAIDDQGNVIVWCDLSNSGGQDRLVVVDANGNQTVVARRGAPTPLSGTFGTMNAWPSLSSTGHATVSAGTPGATAANGHFAGILCGPAVAASPCAPLGGLLRVDDYGPNGAFLLFLATTTQVVPLPPFGTLLLGPGPISLLAGPASYPANAPHTVRLTLPNNANLRGLVVWFQTLALISPAPITTNAASTTIR